MQPLTYRRAQAHDLPALRSLMELAIDRLDTQLIEDGTYLVIESGGRIVGCGGWSRRATLYGGDHAGDLRGPRLLDSATDLARIRAMSTHPGVVRRGVGRLILATCEPEAAVGFARAELIATLADEPPYRARGYDQIERTCAMASDVAVSIVRMGKRPLPEAAAGTGTKAA